MTTFLSSDQHFHHSNIIKLSNRPYANVDEMNRDLIQRHNAVVGPKDIVWQLGDFAWNPVVTRTLLSSMNGTHHLVCGNHDDCHPCHKKHEKMREKYLGWGFASVQTETRLGPFLLNHLPYAGDSGHEARYPQFRPKDQGSWLLHGHVHGSWQVKGRQINVGVDVWQYQPVALDALLAIREAGA